MSSDIIMANVYVVIIVNVYVYVVQCNGYTLSLFLTAPSVHMSSGYNPWCGQTLWRHNTLSKGVCVTVDVLWFHNTYSDVITRDTLLTVRSWDRTGIHCKDVSMTTSAHEYRLTAETGSECAGRVFKHFPVFTSQIRTLSSNCNTETQH